MNEATEAIDRLVSNLETILRYVAPGFAALVVIAIVFPDSHSFLLPGSAAAVVLAFLLGPTIYGIHKAIVHRLFWWLIVWLLELKRPSHAWNTLSKLDDERWRRRATKDDKDEKRSIQRELDKWAAMLNFLYCLSYTMILIPLMAGLCSCWRVGSLRWIILIGGIGILLATLCSEYRISWKELTLAKNQK